MLKIYLAARYSRRKEMMLVADVLRGEGFEVTSRWITGEQEKPGKDDRRTDGPNAYTTDEKRGFAEDDLADIDRADAFIAFTEPPDAPSNRGGRHVETGYAIAKGKLVAIVGPLENVFCCLDTVYRADDLSDVISFLSGYETFCTAVVGEVAA